MAVFDVGPILEGISSLQGRLEDAITKTRLLLEAIEGSQSKYTERTEEYPVLRSLKGRLAASQGPNESLSTELVKFKLELESFVDDIFNSHDSARTIRRNSLLQAKEVEANRDQLWYEKGELAAERKRLDLEREELKALRSATTKTPAEGNINLNGVERIEKPVEQPLDSVTEENIENSLRETCDACCQTEPERNLVVETKCRKEEDSNRANVECQTEPTCITYLPRNEEQKIKKERDTSHNIMESFAVSEVFEDTLQAKHPLPLSGRPHTMCRAAAAGTHQRVATAPVSRAKVLLLSRQGYVLRIHKTLLDEVSQLKEEIQYLKLENSELTKRANEANSELFYVKNRLTVNIADRDELLKKLHKYKGQVQKLEDTLKKQAYGLVHNKKQQRQFEEELRWSQILAVPLYDHSSRSRNISQEGKSTKGR